MADQYDKIYGYGSDIAAALREDDAVSKAYAALPTVTKAIEPPPEERTVTEPHQETFSAKWNAWFAESFKNHIRADRKNIHTIAKAIGGETGQPNADGTKPVTVPSLGNEVLALEKAIQFIVKMLGGKIDDDGKSKTLTLPKLDSLIADRVEKILKERQGMKKENENGS